MLGLSKRTCSLALAAALLAPSYALAQPAKHKTVREELSGDARAKWESAISLFTARNWDGAEADFMRAYELSKNPRTLFNVAICEKNRGRYNRAIDIFKQELAEGPGKISAEEEAQVKEVIAGLQKFVSTLVIEVNEPGATISIDGTPVGTSPLASAVRVEVGERKVTVSKPGWADAMKPVTISGGVPANVALRIDTIVKLATVEVSVIGAPGATVKVDGKEVPAVTEEGAGGARTVYKGRLAVTNEPHTFEAEAPGFVRASQTAQLVEGQPLNLTLSLAREQAKGKLVVQVQNPPGATIEIDGKAVGANRWEGPVDGGNHQVVVKKAGFYTWSYDVDVPRGNERSVSAQLNEDRNNSFVPWLIGTIVVVGVGTVAAAFMFSPQNQNPVVGTLPPGTIEHQGRRF